MKRFNELLKTISARNQRANLLATDCHGHFFMLMEQFPQSPPLLGHHTSDKTHEHKAGKYPNALSARNTESERDEPGDGHPQSCEHMPYYSYRLYSMHTNFGQNIECACWCRCLTVC